MSVASMPTLARRARILAIGGAAGALAASTLAAGPAGAATSAYRQTNQVSDIPGVARITDPNLVNPWGISAGPTTPQWVNDNGTNVATLYSGAVHGKPPAIVPLVVSIPGGAPTGQVFTGGSGFNVGGSPAFFVFDSEAGIISAWQPGLGTSAMAVASVPNAVYKGLALADNHLFAADFHHGRVEVFDSSFNKVTPAGSFHDPGLPPRFAPFGIAAIGGNIYVSYAKQGPGAHDEIDGAHLGFIDVYSTSGALVKRFASRGPLNAPWGMTIAPSGFGTFSHDLLVGNFGDGRITAYDPMTGAMLGQLHNTDGNPITIDGLWALMPGNGVFAGTQQVIFSAGIAAESHGLLGTLAAQG